MHYGCDYDTNTRWNSLAPKMSKVPLGNAKDIYYQRLWERFRRSVLDALQLGEKKKEEKTKEKKKINNKQWP